MVSADKDGKGKVNTVVIHSNPQIREALERAIGNQHILNLAGSYSSLENYSTIYPKKHNQLFLVEERQGVYLAEELRNNGSLAPLISVSESRSSDLANLVNTGALAGNLDIGELLDFKRHDRELSQIIKNLTDKSISRKLEQKLKVGIVGMGKFGHNILREMIGESWLSEAVVFSNYFNSKIACPTLDILCKTPYGGEKVKTVFSLKDFFAAQPDIVYIAEGPYNADYSKPRPDFTEENLIPSWKKVAPVLEARQEAGHKGLVCILTHPPGPYLTLAHTRYKIPANQITANSSDVVRAKQALFNHIDSLFSGSDKIDKKDLTIDVLGEHGIGPVLSYEGALALTAASIFLGEGPKESIAKWVKEVGGKIMSISNSEGINYFDVPRTIRDGIESIASFQRDPGYSWYCHLGTRQIQEILGERYISGMNHAFLMVPTTLKYSPLRVHNAIKVDKLNPQVKEGLANCLIKQNAWVKRIEKEA